MNAKLIFIALGFLLVSTEFAQGTEDVRGTAELLGPPTSIQVQSVTAEAIEFEVVMEVAKPKTETENLAIENVVEQSAVNLSDISTPTSEDFASEVPSTETLDFEGEGVVAEIPNELSISMSTTEEAKIPDRQLKATGPEWVETKPFMELREVILRLIVPNPSSMIYPLQSPAPVTSRFGWRLHPFLQIWREHTGLDLGAESGSPVVAVQAGKVIHAGALGNYGLTVLIDDGNLRTLYAHLSAVFVEEDQWIDQGIPLGLVGMTGYATGSHLHFEVQRWTYEGWQATDPEPFLAGTSQGEQVQLKRLVIPRRTWILP